MTRRAFTTHPLVVREVRVLGVSDVTPRMRRITVGGEQLGGFVAAGALQPAFASPGFDDHVKLVFAADGNVAGALPVQLSSGIEWVASDTRQGRDYTPRAVRVSTNGEVELDLDFVRHGHGPAATWADEAAVGDPLFFVGPKSSTVLPADLEWIVLAGDETALPAIGRFLDERPTSAPAHIVIAIRDPSAVQKLATRPSDTVEWVVDRPGALLAAVRALELPATGYLWAGGESAELLPLRRYAARELGMPASHVNVTGYWHVRGTDEEPESHEPASPLGWLVVRAALALGILDVLADAEDPATPESLAAAVGVDAARLSALLPVLRTHGLLGESPAGAVTLGPLGETLLDDESEREEYVGLAAEMLLSLADLAEALPVGAATWQSHAGLSLEQWSSQSSQRFAALVEPTAGLAFLLDGFRRDAVWRSLSRATLTGPGAGVIADALATELPTVQVWESGAGLGALTAATPRPDRFSWTSDPAPGADIVIAAMALAHRTDDEARTLLHAIRAVSTRLVVIERTRTDSLGGHADADVLLAFARTGSPPRDPQTLAELGDTAGWRLERVTPLGWGIDASWFAADA